MSKSQEKFRLLVFNKPMGVLTRFTDKKDRLNLASYIDVPRVYPVGRLDKNSEGLLLLTDRGSLVEPLLSPGSKSKTYLVCVEGAAVKSQLDALSKGLVLKDGPTRPAGVRLLDSEPEWLWERDPPIRFRKSVPVSWLEIEVKEGRNRQVRRMTAAVGLPTLRLIRTEFAHFLLADLMPGDWREATPGEKSAALALESARRRRGRRSRGGRQSD